MTLKHKFVSVVAFAAMVVTGCLPAARPGSLVEVRPGDSFYRIAARYHVKPSALAKANGMTYASMLQPGMKLRLPGQSGPTPTTRKPSQPTPTTKRPRQPTPTTARPTTPTTLKVRRTAFSLTDAERARVVQLGLSKVPGPYVSGGNGPNVFDCSGLVFWTYSQVGSPIGDNTAHGYSRMVQKIPESQVKPGDLVFFGSGTRIGHVGINIGNGRMVEAANSRKGLRVSKWSDRRDFQFAGRM